MAESIHDQQSLFCEFFFLIICTYIETGHTPLDKCTVDFYARRYSTYQLLTSKSRTNGIIYSIRI